MTKFENILKIKSATAVDRIVKGLLIRKKVKITRIIIMIMAKRITNWLRKNYQKKFKLINKAFKKLTYLIKKIHKIKPKKLIG